MLGKGLFPKKKMAGLWPWWKSVTFSEKAKGLELGACPQTPPQVTRRRERRVLAGSKLIKCKAIEIMCCAPCAPSPRLSSNRQWMWRYKEEYWQPSSESTGALLSLSDPTLTLLAPLPQFLWTAQHHRTPRGPQVKTLSWQKPACAFLWKGLKNKNARDVPRQRSPQICHRLSTVKLACGGSQHPLHLLDVK